MKVLLYHNESAGSRDAPTDELRRPFLEAGFDVEEHKKSSGRPDPETLDGIDIVVIAGGDGTVAKAMELFGEADVRFAAIPLGTANNIATCLGATAGIDALARGLANGTERLLDIGAVDGLDEPCLFVEAVGLGALAEGLADAHEAHLSGDEKLKAGRDALAAAIGRGDGLGGITVDGAALPEDLLLAEILNMPISGPGLCLAPDSSPGDGLLDVAYLRRERAGAFLEALQGGCPLPLDVVRGRRVEVDWSGARMRIDDEFLPPPGEVRRLAVTLRHPAARFIVPTSETLEDRTT